MHTLIHDFGKNIGIPDLALDEHHYCCLQFDGVVVNLEYEPDKDELFLYTHLGRIPQDPSLALYERLLEANFFFRQTGGGVLGIDKATGIIALAWRLPASPLTLPALEKLMETFVNTAEYWTEQVGQSEPTEQTTPPVDFIRA